MSYTNFLNTISVIVPKQDQESLRVNLVDKETNTLYCTGEESGEQYQFNINEMDHNDFFYFQLTRCEYLN